MSDPIASENLEHRAEGRFALEVPVSTRQRGSHQMPATLHDLSCGGCRIGNACLARSAEDEIFIRIPGLESLPARVCWTDGSAAGLQFERALHPAVFQRITALHRHGSREPAGTGYEPANDTVVAIAPRRERPAGSRRDQIVGGYVIPDPGVLLDKNPADGGKSMFTLVRRNTARNADHRHEQRFPAPAEIEVRVGDRAELTTVANLSTCGVMAAGDLAQEIGDSIEVRFSGHEPIWGTVIWKRGRQFGISLPPESIELDAA